MLPAIWNAFTAGRDNGELKKRPGFFADRTRASHERICGLEKPAIKMKALVDKNLCTGCGACESECPAGAIKVSELAEVDATLCTGCGACVEACPLEALSMK
jgi:ferredoxin